MATTKFLDGEGLKILWKRLLGKFLPLSGGVVTGTIKAPGFVHSQFPSSSQHVLLANGGTTHISTLGGSGSGSYLPLSGGTMNNGATITGKNLTISNSPSENDWGDLYLGNAYNNGMIAVQTDMYGLDKSITGKNTWNIYTNGGAEFESLVIGGKGIGNGTITASKFKVNGGTLTGDLTVNGGAEVKSLLVTEDVQVTGRLTADEQVTTTVLQADTIKKSGLNSTNDFVLLAGGGVKRLSEIGSGSGSTLNQNIQISDLFGGTAQKSPSIPDFDHTNPPSLLRINFKDTAFVCTLCSTDYTKTAIYHNSLNNYKVTVKNTAVSISR